MYHPLRYVGLFGVPQAQTAFTSIGLRDPVDVPSDTVDLAQFVSLAKGAVARVKVL